MQGSVAVYYLMWVLFMLGYLCAGPIPHQVLIARWFVKSRGTAMAISYLGLGLGGAISQKYVFMPLIAMLGWRGALRAFGLALLVLILANDPWRVLQRHRAIERAPRETVVAPPGGR